MGLHKISVALVCFIVVAVFSTSHAQNSLEDFLNAHNEARQELGVGQMTWNDTVAAYALNYANTQAADCPNLVHSGGPYGENLAAGTGKFTAKQAVGLWVDEKQYYDHNSNSCKEKVCGHYTQVVWRNSIRLGCARVRCSNNTWWYVICSYDPRGNIVGQRPDAVAIFSPPHAPYSREDFLNAHNAARKEVGVGQMTWDDTVASYAQDHANQRMNDCNLVHSGGRYGENLAESFTDVNAVQLWVSQKANYDYNSNSCRGGECLNYIQVVWRNSVRLGCARVQCRNISIWFVTCNYDPPGNFVGHRPY